MIIAMDVDYEGQAQANQKKRDTREKRLKTAACEVMNSEAGRLILSEILTSYCQLEGQNHAEGVQSGRIEGARIVGLQLVNLLRSSDTALFLKLYTEIFCNER